MLEAPPKALLDSPPTCNPHFHAAAAPAALLEDAVTHLVTLSLSSPSTARGVPLRAATASPRESRNVRWL